MDIIRALRDPNLLGSLFKSPETWRAWEVYLAALFGLPIGAGDMALFRQCTGLERAPVGRVRESFVICGRRSGKSFISAIVAVYLACFKDWRPYLAPGEQEAVFVIENDKNQAGIIKRYVSGILHGPWLFKTKIENETQETIELSGGVSIAIKTCSFRTLRGYTLLGAVLEELAFWRSEGTSSNPDKEILAAVRPALATIPESLLIGISTPYSRAGVLWDAYRTHFGKEGGPLIWTAPSSVMNPTLDKNLIERAIAEDPQAARSEWEAAWRSDVEVFISQELVEAVTVPGRHELPRVSGARYFGFADPSGGRQDSFTLAVAHRDGGGKVILDVLRERRPPFQPKAVVAEFSETLKAFGIFEVGADRYAGEWVASAFKECGITVKPSALSASELYINLLPMIANGTAELLENKRLVGQLAGLERRVRPGGKDLIAHYPGGHDDLANAVAGAFVAAGRNEAEPMIFSLGGREDDDFDDWEREMIRRKHPPPAPEADPPEFASFMSEEFIVRFLAAMKVRGGLSLAARALKVDEVVARRWYYAKLDFVRDVAARRREEISHRVEEELGRAGGEYLGEN